MFKSVAPIQASRSTRPDRGRGVTTSKAGKIVPLRYIPLLREDRLSRANVSVTIELAETVRPLINAVYADVEAWFIPYASFERFNDLGDYNRSYAKINDPKTGTLEPFLTTAAWAGSNPAEFWKVMGIHGVAGASMNMAPLEAYNTLINHIYDTRSPNLPERTALDGTLATAFWVQNRFSEVVPNYDRSSFTGVVPVTGQDLTVRGLGTSGAVTNADFNTSTGVKETGADRAYARYSQVGATETATTTPLYFEADVSGRPIIKANLASGALSIGLANIDLARQTAAFDALRKRYEGHDDAEIIELLMEGIRVPEFMERMPYMLASRRTQFSFGTRYATDAANLETSITNGVAQVNMSLSTPRSNTGGIVMIVASVVPDQMFERRRDPFLAITDHDLWPKYERDTLDVEKVDQVLAADVDTYAASPGAIFGYEPMNNKWARDFVRLGGRMYKPTNDSTYNEERAVLWITEPANPTLSANWYLANGLNADPFKDRVNDHLTITTIHEGAIDGHTVFGPKLLEIPV